jgi:type II secretory pathway component PulF
VSSVASTAPLWRWTGADAAGQRRTGRVRAASADAAHDQLTAAGVTVGQIRPVRTPQRTRRATTADTASVAAVVAQLHTLHVARLPLAAAFRATAADTRDRDIADALAGVAVALDDGSSPREALAAAQPTLGPLFTAQLAAAVDAQDLDGALSRLAEDLDGQAAIDTELAAALTAPKWGGLVALVMIAVAIGYVVPLMADIHTLLGDSLALPTRVLLGLRANALLAVGGAALVAVAVTVGWSTVPEPAREQLLWRVPWTGPLRRQQSTHRWLLATVAIHRSGVPLADAVTAGAAATASPAVAVHADRISRRLIDGDTVRDAFADLPLVGDTTKAILAAGTRQADQFDRAATAAAADLAQQQRRATAGLGAKVQAATTGLVIVVLLLALSGLWLPIFQLINLT